MNKKTWILVAVAVVLGAFYIVHFSSWFKPNLLLISHNERFGRINFSLSSDCLLTDVKVVSVSALASNKYALPAWELTSGSNSVPTRIFSYGERIRGMKPVVDNAVPEQLVPGQTYKLIVQAGSRKAEHEFTPNSAVSNGRRGNR